MLLQLALFIQLRANPAGEFYLTMLALILVVIATFITVRFVVPINAIVHTWSSALPPPDWQVLRHKWGAFHLIRTVLVTAALVAQILPNVLARRF